MSIARTLRRTAAAVTALASAPALVAAAGESPARNEPHLLGRAVLPVETYASGPPAGAGLVVPPGPTVINGITFPTPSQPVEGFSGIVTGRRPGEYLAMPDNGFGNKANSFDFLIRAYYLRPDFETARGGSGSVDVADFVSFRDPNGEIDFAIVNEASPERLLTGADIDPESIQRGRNGDLWLGDEFGPWILHFDRAGVLLEPPIALPDGLQSPANPDLEGGALVGGSRGIEAMAMSPDRRTLTVVLEGALADDDPASRRVYQYDTVSRQWTRRADYRVTAPGGSEGARFVADAQAIDNHRLLVIERDGGRGATATYRRVYSVDLAKVDADGFVRKSEVVDLAAIPDPDLISLPAAQGDVGLGDPFRVACESIEALHVLSHSTLLLGCDNNFPNDGRNPSRADDNEFILVKAPGL